MTLFKNSILIGAYQLKRWKKDYRVYIIAIMLMILIFNNTRQIVDFSNMTGVRVSPWILPILLENYMVSMGLLKVLILFGMVLLFCDAPFNDNVKPHIIARTGRNAWCFGEILYIAAASFFYTLFVLIVGVSGLASRLSFDWDWGKVLGTLAMTNAGAQYVPTLCFNSQMISAYTPLSATALSFLNLWLFGMVMGLLIYCINLFSTAKEIGMALVSLIILIDPVVCYLEKPAYYWLSPASWVSLSSLSVIGGYKCPPEIYALFIYGITIVILSCIAYQKSKTRMVEIENN